MALMKSKHPFITTSEDTCLAVILAMTDKSVDDILNELENTYVTIKSRFTFHENAAYSLAQVLTAFEGDYESKCGKALDLFNEFKTVGSGYGKEYELASLGILTNISMNTGDMVVACFTSFESEDTIIRMATSTNAPVTTARSIIA